MHKEKELQSSLHHLNGKFEGELHLEDSMRTIYATDASSYRELPLAVAYPKNEADIQLLISFAKEHGTSLIPRTAGTSLAGQVVGAGIVVDVSKHFNKILEINTDEQWVRVQPGVVRDELNQVLRPLGFLFGPETSTSNRAMIGGMIGNNSCGSNSIVFGSTRDHLLEAHAFLSDGSPVIFEELDKGAFDEKCKLDSLEGKIYASIQQLLTPEHVKQEIKSQFPLPQIPRRNTGYAIDLLAQMAPISSTGKPFNFCRLLAGSEGTLAFVTEAKLHINSLPPKFSGLLCAHFTSIYESLKATQVAVNYQPFAVELMDHFILECTKDSPLYSKNRFFIQGDPQAIIVVELRSDSYEDLESKRDGLIGELKSKGYGYHYPFVTGSEQTSVWNLRKAGLGLLSNMPGDAKPVPVIEDTAVTVDDLPEFIKEFNERLETYNLKCVHYAHAGSGELHLRPILDLKTKEGNELFRKVAEEISHLVKKYKGSLSGEHGDGRLRGEFIPFMIGEKNFEIIKSIKKTWDPDNLFNPGKIVDTPSMNSSLRFIPGQVTPEFDTFMDFSKSKGFVRSAEQCNGSGDCRKTHHIGGTMCPSFMATRDEKDTTRARANMIREVFTNESLVDAMSSKEVKDILDLCLSCKGCKMECPSNVDMAKLKAEFLMHYQSKNGIPLRSRLIAKISSINSVGSLFPGVYNWLLNGLPGTIGKKLLGIAPKRDFPRLDKQTLRNWFYQQTIKRREKKVYLFVDEFSNYSETSIGKMAIGLLDGLGYEVKVVQHAESGRAAMSKGMLHHSKKCAEKNVSIFHPLVNEKIPLLGLEPSAILSFKDEYPSLLSGDLKEKATDLASNVFTVESFIVNEFAAGRISEDAFTDDIAAIKLHGHCHQKALGVADDSHRALEIPKNFTVDVIPSGCCGMAGSFGFEKEHIDLSMKIGELVLFPEVRAAESSMIAAPGTSCRHQIHDGTGVSAMHPVQILYHALKKH